jgi:hypothetical protein
MQASQCNHLQIIASVHRSNADTKLSVENVGESWFQKLGGKRA